MERFTEKRESPLVDLGTASIETQGALGNIIEPMGLWHTTGIGDE